MSIISSLPNGAHQGVHKELVFLSRGFLPCIPHFAVAALHEPPLQIDRMRDEGIRCERVGGEREALKRRMEVGDAVLREQSDEVEPAYWVFAWGGW